MKSTLRELIHISEGFQYSVNVKYDLFNKLKVSRYIPLFQSIEVIRDIIKSNKPGEKQRSRIIIGSYGTGKSHLSTVLLSILGKILPLDDYNELLKKIENISPDDAKLIETELKGKKLLPVVISPNGNDSLEQLFLSSLSYALQQANLGSIMPDTIYKAAEEQIAIWKKEYPLAYNRFLELLATREMHENQLINSLRSFDNEAYSLFINLYHEITHGAFFQPLLTGNPIDIYQSVAAALPNDMYQGIIVLFDEFGKYLEDEWERGSINNRFLQDFAEACNSSELPILQFVLITHKPISQYATRYGQELVNEWKKVEGRFKSIELINPPSKIYTLISQVLLKDNDAWKRFLSAHHEEIKLLTKSIQRTQLFAELTEKDFYETVVEGGYPLHPITTFCLPRISQKIAQNERTLFTFLSSSDFSSLGEFLRNQSLEDFNCLTIDSLFDYFSNQLKESNINENPHKIWVQTISALNRLNDDEQDEAKLLKALAVIKIIDLPVLPPNEEMLSLAFLNSTLNVNRFSKAFANLLKRKIIYRGQSTGNLEFLEASEIDVAKEIEIIISKRRSLIEPWDFLNQYFIPKPVIAKKYNVEYTMTRYFSCVFQSVEQVIKNGLDEVKNILDHDGRIFYIIPKSEEEYQLIETYALMEGKKEARAIFYISKGNRNIKELEDLVCKYDALLELEIQIEKGQYKSSDRLETQLWILETRKEIEQYINESFLFNNSIIISCGEVKSISNKAELSRLVSDLCTQVYCDSPKFNNEMINKHSLTAPILKARQKIVDGLLKQFLGKKLGIVGSGPELSIYKSILLCTGILKEQDDLLFIAELNLVPDRGLVKCLKSLNQLLSDTSETRVSFKKIIEHLSAPPFGVRQGLIPILLAVVFHKQKNEIIIVDNFGIEQVLNSQTIEAGMKEPERYFVLKQDWAEFKSIYCSLLSDLFSNYIDQGEGLYGPSKQVLDAIRRWFFSLPRFTRDSKLLSDKAKEVRRIIRQEGRSSLDVLFKELPKVLIQADINESNYKIIFNEFKNVKEEMDSYFINSILTLERNMLVYIPRKNESNTLLGRLKHWYQNLDVQQRERLYSDGTQEVMDKIEAFSGENSIDFLKEIFSSISGLRPEDWNDSSLSIVENNFKEIINEVESFKEYIDESAATSEIIITFKNENSIQTKRTFKQASLSPTGEILQNLLSGYIEEYGDAITNNEKRLILLNLLEKITK